MKTKVPIKQQIKEWWHDNKNVVKTGVVCGLLGIGYGFIKGLSTSDKMWMDHGFTRAVAEDEPCDDFEYNESNVDDPELLELIRTEGADSLL